MPYHSTIQSIITHNTKIRILLLLPPLKTLFHTPLYNANEITQGSIENRES